VVTHGLSTLSQGFFCHFPGRTLAVSMNRLSLVRGVGDVHASSAAQVQVRFGSASGAWHRCSPSSGRFVCDVASPGADLEAIDTFELLATG